MPDPNFLRNLNAIIAQNDDNVINGIGPTPIVGGVAIEEEELKVGGTGGGDFSTAQSIDDFEADPNLLKVLNEQMKQNDENHTEQVPQAEADFYEKKCTAFYTDYG